ncbi:MAG: membrane protein insertion efficiency factor YidD [Deltaproteobacteria bacterium]|nr:membrane protein insertion efficiency factor YidD [Deltaproteobacteria bacterium]
MTGLILCGLLFSFTTSPLYAKDPFNGPVQKIKSKNLDQPWITSTPTLIGLGMIRFFSKVISPLDGPKSPSYPTGSAYGYQAVKKKGLFWGAILTADRLFHETDRPLGPLITIWGKNRYYDPVENNIFWWDNDTN